MPQQSCVVLCCVCCAVLHVYAEVKNTFQSDNFHLTSKHESICVLVHSSIAPSVLQPLESPCFLFIQLPVPPLFHMHIQSSVHDLVFTGTHIHQLGFNQNLV